MKLSFDSDLEREALITTLESYIVHHHFKDDVLAIIKIDEIKIRITGFYVIFRVKSSRSCSFITYGKHIYWACFHAFIEKVKKCQPPTIDCE